MPPGYSKKGTEMPRWKSLAIGMTTYSCMAMLHVVLGLLGFGTRTKIEVMLGVFATSLFILAFSVRVVR